MTRTKHSLFQLLVNEHGLNPLISAPEHMSTFLLLISEAISNGFWTEANQQTT